MFTASHGMVWPSGDPRQIPAQGALLCQDWPGFGAVAGALFSASDVPDSARLGGMITFHFACYGGGTPLNDLYAFEKGEVPPAIAPKPFIAALPPAPARASRRRRPRVIAHVERAWGRRSPATSRARRFVRSSGRIAQLMVGMPVGMAVQEFNDLSATVSDVLTRVLGDAFHGNPWTMSSSFRRGPSATTPQVLS